MKESKLIKWIILLPILGVILTSFILTNIFISSIHEKHDIEIANLKHQHINNLKNSIQERIDHLAILLENAYHRQVKNSKHDVKNIVDLGYKIIENIYTQNKHLSKKELFKLIDIQMRDTRFFKNDSGYYFIYDLQDGISISLPSAPQLVGSSLKKLKDVNGKNLFDSYGAILEQHGEGFDTWYWNKPGSKVKLEKVGYVKKFAPLNIAIGTAIYTEDIQANIANNALDSIMKLHFADNSYVFVMNTQGTSLHHKVSAIIGIPLEQLDTTIQKNVHNIIQKAVSSTGSFLEYTQSKQLFEENISRKISYVKYVKELDWVIGTGLYTDRLNEEILKRSNVLNQKLQNDIKTIVIISLLVSIIVIIIVLILSKKLNNRFEYYSNKLEQSNNELKSVNSELEQKVEEQVANIREKDLILNQQSKLTAMGEMLGNISHQWRQPLSAISTLASGIVVQKEMGMISDKQLDEDLNSIVQSTQVLSQTIDDFRNFYSRNKQLSKFELQEAIDKVLNLVDANLKHYEIENIVDIDAVNVMTYKNELIQVILNILNNAKDALKDSSEKRYIFIQNSCDNNLVTLDIFDNAGGIDESIITKVFDPYFTTKGEEEGTGIGLYMSQNIVQKSLKGQLLVQNHEFTYQGVAYKGAKFSIILAL